MIEKLEQVDEILASYEDWMHGTDGENCTKARKLLIEVMKEVKNISFNPVLGNVIERFEMPKIGVYLLFTNDILIYIGKSINIFQRLQSHLKDKYFDSYSFYKCDSDKNATKLEKELIIRLKPKLNIQHKIKDIQNAITQNKEFTLNLKNRLKYLNDESEFWRSL